MRRAYPGHTCQGPVSFTLPPKHALKKLWQGQAGGLNGPQLQALYHLTGLDAVQIDKIMQREDTPVKEGWIFKPEKGKSIFYQGKYRVEYIPPLNIAYLYKNGELVADHIMVAQTILLKDFTKDMELLIASIEGKIKNSLCS